MWNSVRCFKDEDVMPYTLTINTSFTKTWYNEPTLWTYVVTMNNIDDSDWKISISDISSLLPEDVTNTEWYHTVRYKNSWFNEEIDFDDFYAPDNWLEISIYGKEEINTYEVKFDSNGWDWTIENQAFTYWEEKSLSENTFSKVWYHLLWWSKNSNDSDPEYTNNEVVKNLSTEDKDIITLYAIWEINKYYIIFSGWNWNIEWEMEEQIFTYNESQKISKNVYKKAYSIFSWWNTSINWDWINYEDEQEVINLSEEHEWRIYLFAVWNPTWADMNIANITWTINEDIITISWDPQPNSESVEIMLKNWYEYETIDTVDMSVWKYSYTVLECPLSNNFSFLLTPKSLDWTGAEIEITFDPPEYNVTFNSNWWSFICRAPRWNCGGGSNNPTPNPDLSMTRQLKYCWILWTLPNTARQWYRLEWWFTEREWWMQVTSQSPVNKWDITYYVHRTPITYTIKFNANEWEWNIDDINVTYDQEYPLPENTFIRENYTFSWWSLSAEWSWIIYQPWTKVSNLTSTNLWEITLYANWIHNLIIKVEDENTTWAIIIDDWTTVTVWWNTTTNEPEVITSEDDNSQINTWTIANEITETLTWNNESEIWWVVDINYSDGSWNVTWAIFSSPVAIKIHVPNGWNWPNWKDYMVKVKHTMDKKYWFSWLTLNPWAQCVDGLLAPENQYKWEVIIPTLIWNQYYVIIYTCSASTFVAYAETPIETPSNPWNNWWWSNWWGGWWWGGWSSYSCKNLPANAIANNKSTPKSNTDYYYSTDTSKVCTFQCNTGYAWNSTNSKCEKTEAITWDIKDEPKVDENKTGDNTIGNVNSSRYEEWNQSEILSNWFSREFNNAYKFAYEYWITTMDDISKADMNWPLNRIAMAKMLSNYAINILGKKPDKTKKCIFPDVNDKLNKDYNDWVTLACQLGIMGVWIEKFRPYDPVNRWEFGTALSRMLFWLSDGNPYYSTHLKQLKTKWIISNDNPDLKELRGYVMLMLMRSAM